MDNKIEVKKIYKIGNREFNSLEEVEKVMATEIVEKFLKDGVDSIVENHVEFIKNLKILANVKYSNVGKSNLKDLKEFLEKSGSTIARSPLSWPEYIITTKEETYKIKFTGKVWELFDLISQNGLPSVDEFRI